MTIHTDFRRGTKVRVMYKDGRPHTVARFIKNGSGVIHLDDFGARIKITLADVRSVTIERARSIP